MVVGLQLTKQLKQRNRIWVSRVEKMAIRALFSCGGMKMTEEEFKSLLKQIDLDGDGRISKEELRIALKRMGKWFCTKKAENGLRYADKNGNGYIDPNEIDDLVAFAKKYWGVNIVPQ